jgi:hypothetical protein
MTPKAGRHKPPVVSFPTTPGTTTTVTTTTETSSLEEATTSNLRPLRHVEANVVRHGEPLTFLPWFSFQVLRIRMRILGSLPLTNRSGWESGEAQKHDADPEHWYRTFTSFFKDRNSKRIQKNSRNQGFSYYFCLMMKDPYL